MGTMYQFTRMDVKVEENKYNLIYKSVRSMDKSTGTDLKMGEERMYKLIYKFVRMTYKSMMTDVKVGRGRMYKL